MLDIDSTLVTRVTRELLSVPAGDSIIEVARGRRARTAITLLSALEKEGRPLPVDVRRELLWHRQRADSYRKVVEDLTHAGLLVVELKGARLMRLYPCGLERQANDIDILASDTDDFWRCCRRLADTGWAIDGLSMRVVEGIYRPKVVFTREARGLPAHEAPYRVEVASYALYGNGLSVPVRVELPTVGEVVELLLLILEERFEQPFRARDIIDAAVLFAHDDSARKMFEQVDRFHLYPECVELVRILNRFNLGPESLPSDARARVRAERALRLRRVLSLGPINAMRLRSQQAIMEAAHPRWSMLNRVGLGPPEDPLRALELGMPVFGRLLDSPHFAALTVRHLRNPECYVADTLIGSFALTANGSLRESSLTAHGLTVAN